MSMLLKDDGGIPIPQYANAQGDFESSHGADGAIYVHDNQLVTVLDRIETIQNRVAVQNQDIADIKQAVADMANAISAINQSIATIVSLLEAPLQDITRNIANIPEPTQSSGGGE